MTHITTSATLPEDADRAVLVGRAWLPGDAGGPCVVTVRNGELIDITATTPTVSQLLENANPADKVMQASGPSLGSLDDWLASTLKHGPNPAHRHLLAPNDLQVVKAAGVTFAQSMVERVIEEQARGDAAAADAVRREVVAVIGSDLSAIRPGSEDAQRLKDVLLEKKMWSQYLEVGIGPDAEIFTKAAPLASVGTGAGVGLHHASSWNNPEPEIVLAVSSRAEIVGASLGNDVNLRDFEGRSALLLGKAKDNNAACAIGPFIRLFDQHFSLDDVRSAEIHLRVEGRDNFVLEGYSSMSQISRDPQELVEHAMGGNHQYPDGMMLFCGTMFAPTKDRGTEGAGFTHHLDDDVYISTGKLGCLANRVGLSDKLPPWEFGIAALFANLAKRGLLG